jgi:hypothetical protein
MDKLLPGKTVPEVLDAIKNDDDLEHISVVMTSGSVNLRYVRRMRRWPTSISKN